MPSKMRVLTKIFPLVLVAVLIFFLIRVINPRTDSETVISSTEELKDLCDFTGSRYTYTLEKEYTFVDNSITNMLVCSKKASTYSCINTRKLHLDFTANLCSGNSYMSSDTLVIIAPIYVSTTLSSDIKDTHLGSCYSSDRYLENLSYIRQQVDKWKEEVLSDTMGILRKFSVTIPVENPIRIQGKLFIDEH